jgi:hypothetical protein
MRHFYIVQKYYINALALCQLRKSCPVQILKEKFRASVGLPFRELLPEVTIQEALNALELNTVADYLTRCNIVDRSYDTVKLLGHTTSKFFGINLKLVPKV